jgi:hypothetical protein
MSIPSMPATKSDQLLTGLLHNRTKQPAVDEGKVSEEPARLRKRAANSATGGTDVPLGVVHP